MSNPRRRNGHRRTQLRNRHLAAATSKTCPWPHCPWPNEPFDPTLPHTNPKAPEVDEITPVSKGGNPLAWSNTRLLHRWCNQQRGDGTRTTRPPTAPPRAATSRPW